MSAFSSTRIPGTLLTLSLLLAIGSSGQQSSIPKEPLRDSLEKIRWKAQTGDSYYQGYLGILHRTGYKGVQLSKAKARHWSSLSAKKKNPLGLANLGSIALWESQTLQNDEPARRRKVLEARQYYEDAYLNGLFRLAQDKGDPLAADLLGDYYHISTEPSTKEEERFYRAAIAKGYPRSMAALGVLQMVGFHNIAKNPKEAVYHFENAAKQNLPVGLFNLAVAYMDGAGGLPKDLPKARSLMKQAADRGFDGARERLAKLDEILKENPGLASSPRLQNPPALRPPAGQPALDPEAAQCLREARSGNPEAQRRLGLMYWVGKGVPKNLSEAKHWLAKAAQQGDKLAEKRLALLERLY